MVAAYVIVSLTIWIVARFSPMEWKERELCDECLLKKLDCGSNSSGIGSDESDDDREVVTLDMLENGFTLGNSFWFAIGSLMQQGSDLNPEVFNCRPAS